MQSYLQHQQQQDSAQTAGSAPVSSTISLSATLSLQPSLDATSASSLSSLPPITLSSKPTADSALSSLPPIISSSTALNLDSTTTNLDEEDYGSLLGSEDWPATSLPPDTSAADESKGDTMLADAVEDIMAEEEEEEEEEEEWVNITKSVYEGWTAVRMKNLSQVDLRAKINRLGIRRAYASDGHPHSWNITVIRKYIQNQHKFAIICGYITPLLHIQANKYQESASVIRQECVRREVTIWSTSAAGKQSSNTINVIIADLIVHVSIQTSQQIDNLSVLLYSSHILIIICTR